MIYESNEQNEVIEFCLKHDLIKKTGQGYMIKKEFYEMLDYFSMERWTNDIKPTTKTAYFEIPCIISRKEHVSKRSHKKRIKT